MKYDNERNYSKENVLRNGTKTQGQYAKSSFNTTIEKPGINESGLMLRREDFNWLCAIHHPPLRWVMDSTLL